MSTLVELKYGYDLSGNREYRRDDKARSYGEGYDERYTYDGLNRLTAMARGTLNSGNTVISSPTLNQNWGLDQLGNWTGFDQSNSSPVYETTRAHNTANEIEGITTDSGSVTWDTPPNYDRNGNMTGFVQPKNVANGYTAEYDAWNRLVKVSDSGGVVAEYEYDGLNRRIRRTEDSNATDFFYNTQWQCLEEQESSSTTKQYVWGERYIDDLALSDEGSTRYYYCQDANFNVVATLNHTGTVVERYAYTPYGVVTYLDEEFDNPSSSSSIGNEYLYTGRRRDAETGLQLNRNRYYHQQLGSWLTRDPIGYQEGLNLYSFPGAPNRVDPSGAITIQTIDKRLNVQCGDIASVLWDFILDNPAPCDGYIVQKVEMRCNIDESCCACPNTSPDTPDATFWEAWRIQQGSRLHNARQGMISPLTDIGAAQIFDNTCGNLSAVGTVKFFCRDKNHPASNGVGTGNLGAIGYQDPFALWLPEVRSLSGKCQVSTGLLPGTQVEPNWWSGKSVDPPVTRSFSASWNCCPFSENFVSAHANPS